MDKVRKRKEAEGSSLSRMGTAILKGNKVSVKWLPDNSCELGYTSAPVRMVRTVNVAWYNDDYFEMLEEIERSTLRMGVFAHELLHQCLTNFEYTHKICETMTQAEAAVFMKFANTLEDPAIEYFAPNIFGGRLLDALRFSIKHIYKLSQGIEYCPTPFSQLITALIHFGDMGIVKGKFTFPEAYEYFAKIAPLYNDGITCPDSKRRIDIAKECMELTRPLWEEEVKNREEFEKLLQELLKSLEAKGIHLFGEKEDSLSVPDDSKAGERRLVIIKSLQKSSPESEDGSSNKSSSSHNDEDSAKSPSSGKRDSAEADGASEEDDSDIEPDTLKGNSSDAKSSDKSESSEEDNEKCSGKDISDEDESCENNTYDEDGSDAEKSSVDESLSGDSDNSDEDENTSSSEDETSAKDSFTGELENLTAPENLANEIIDGEYVIDESVFESIERSIKSEEEKLEKKNRESASAGSGMDILPDFDISSTAFKSATCLNKVVRVHPGINISNLYQEAVTKYSLEIKNLIKSLDKIFKSDVEEMNRATSGSYNIKRGSIGISARIFDKRREPGNLKDAAVVLIVDLSGSMSGEKITQARKTSIIFAEALSALKIPYYIMGFSADTDGADAVHTHFVKWNGAKKDRETLICMDAHGNNFDGYSIRYAAELLKNRTASNKILFVTSDGEPACRTYHGKSGIADTTNAIKEARKHCTVFGIALGTGCNPSVLQNMYGKDFIYCEDEKLLSNTLCKKLGKVIKRQ